MKKRVLAIVLALALAVNLAPAAVYAQDAEYDNMQEVSQPVEQESSSDPSEEQNSGNDTEEPKSEADTETEQETGEETESETAVSEPVVSTAPATRQLFTMARSSFDSSLLNGIPATANPGSGTTAWVADGDVLKSGSAGKAYSTSTLTLTFTADVQIRFEYKVSSEKNYDKFSILHNGTAIVSAVSGEVGWTEYLVTVKSGDTLAFQYTKDGSGNSGDDYASLRNFSAGEAVQVTFHANGGIGEDYVQNFYGQASLQANRFTKDHSVFLGWAATAEGEVLYTDGQSIEKPEAAMDLYAVWADAWVLTFADAGVSVNVKKGEAIGDAAVPAVSKTGYLFAGWYCGDSLLNTGAPVTEDRTYQASWNQISYTIRFHTNNGIGSMDDVQVSYDQEIHLPKSVFVRNGYQFLGWGSSASSASASYADEESVSNLCSKDGDVVELYAVWAGKKVELTIDANYECADQITTRQGVVGENYNYIYNEETGKAKYQSLPDLTREGYLFDGWYTQAEGGEEITTSYKFEDDTPMTLYAHWVKAVTITFHANGGTCYTTQKQIPEGTSYGTLPSASLSGKYFEGWYTQAEGGEAVDKDTIFDRDATLYAHFRNYRYVLKLSANGGEGTMEDMTCDFGVSYTLPTCSYTREGYVFKGWSTSSYSSTVSYPDGGTINRSYYSWYSDGSTYYLYAVWEETVFGKAFRAIQSALPSDGIVRSTGSLELPTAGSSYTVSYRSSNPELISDEGMTVALPETGTAEVTITATVTDLTDNSEQAKEFVLVLYSADALAAEQTLTQAKNSLTGNFKPTYGTDTNACAVVEEILAAKGYEGIEVSVKEAAGSSNGYASIDPDGTIHYYFNPGMTGSAGYFYTTFVLSFGGVSVEKEWYTYLTWDLARAQQQLEQLADSVVLPTEPVTELTLLQYALKEGVDPENVDYSAYANFNTWATITWTSENEDAVKIGDAPSYPYYAPYAVTVISAVKNQTVKLTAHFACNNLDLELDRDYTVTVRGDEEDVKEAIRKELQEKLDAGFEKAGLTDFVTGETLDTGNVTNDIQLPTTRDFGVDGKYQPVTITSSNEKVIETPGVNNAARVYVYRPLPGKNPVPVTLTVTITDKETGVVVSKEILVTVQPLTQAEIDAEIALMEQVKAHYFDGIKNANTSADTITSDLRPFQEAYLDGNRKIVWVYQYTDKTGHGIIPVDMDGWENSEQWRLFKSSNAQVISHENLLVTRDKEHKAVTVTSWLSSETLGKYAEKYPDNAQLQKLYKQPVSVNLVVKGTNPTTSQVVVQKMSATFTLKDNNSVWIRKKVENLSEGSTVYDLFSQVLAANHYRAIGGTFVTGIVKPDGTVLKEKDRGENSGWMYSVNGKVPNKVMSQYYLKDGDSVVFFYTDDYTKVAGMGTSDSVTPEEVIRLINAIGSVNRQSADKIQAARAAYEKLSQTERAKVTNYQTLLEAEKAYAALLKNVSDGVLDIYTITGNYIEDLDEEELLVYGKEWLVFGLARSGREVPETYYENVEAYLRENMGEDGRLEDGRCTDIARLVLTLSALDKDVEHVAGYNLLAPLADLDYVESQGLSSVIYTLLALDCRDYEIPETDGDAEQTTRELLIAYLLERQLPDGGWSYFGEDPEADMTAMVLQALAPYCEEDETIKEAVEKGIACLSELQTPTGGYTSSDELTGESAAQVIVALTALGIDPGSDSRFVKNGVSVLDSLCGFYVDGGGFRHVMSGDRDVIATAQGYYALCAYYRYVMEDTGLYDMSDLDSEELMEKAS